MLALLVLGLSYASYAGLLAAWSYLELSGVVDQALADQARSGAGLVRAAIIKGAQEAGVRIDGRNVVVGETERALAVRLEWSWPVIAYQGREILEVPLSLERSLARP
ncbi:MAG: hypothetical protein AUH81_16880 [Candidatus Rokubacteria bacterium 13_1_40CM_4_69_5]|nr:MAG: hypothetical protein AUH81_16880 [Candidatus Rokubacteria bacterium 13_1_40CM_4_69_5]